MSFFTIYQDQLFPTAELSRGEREKIDSFLQVLEESGVGKIIYKETNKDKSLGGRNSYNPYRLFAAIIYAFSKHSGSLRKIEESIKFDLRFIYILNQETPSYVTISKFLNNVVVKHFEAIFAAITKTILLKYNLCIDDCFIDGTKIEANANKYKFVYKPTKFKIKLFDKIKKLLIQYFPISDNKNTFVSKEVATYLSLEFMLICLGYNIRKLFTLIEGKAKTDCWIAPADLKPESIPVVDYEKILKKKRKLGPN
ncbi:MAG: transposase, partial [Roseburia sp.]|nr:transposase [Roseburia sp.]